MLLVIWFRSGELDLMIAMGPFQLEIFYDSKSMEPDGIHP